MARSSNSAGRLWILSGLDPSGRAGLLADVEAARAAGTEPFAVATALTAQGEGTFRSAPVSTRVLARQLEALFELQAPSVVKLGMVPNRAQLSLLRERLSASGRKWVVDPVVRTSRGQRLSNLRPRDYLELADEDLVLTPNVPELAWLLGAERPPRELAEAREWAERLLGHGFGAVVLKGGHLSSAPIDLVCEQGRTHALRGVRIAQGVHRRGTGCRFASTLAASLTGGATVLHAARTAKRAVARYLATPSRALHKRQVRK